MVKQGFFFVTVVSKKASPSKSKLTGGKGLIHSLLSQRPTLNSRVPCLPLQQGKEKEEEKEKDPRKYRHTNMSKKGCNNQ